MKGKRYEVNSRRRSPSPRRPPPRSRDFSPRRGRTSPYRRREIDEYSRHGKTSRRIEKMDHLDGNSDLQDLRFSNYDNRDRDGYVVDGRGYRSPRRVEKRDDFDRPVSFSDFGDGDKGTYGNGVSAGRSNRGFGSSMIFQGDPLLDGGRKTDYLSMKDYGLTRDSSGVGDSAVIRGGDRDYYPHNRYLDSGQGGLVSGSQFVDSAKPNSVKYESGGRIYSHSYPFSHGEVDDIPISNLSGGDGRSHMSSVAAQYLNTEADKQRHFHFRDKLHLERRDGLHDQDERKNDGLHFQDRFLETGKTVDREIYKFKKEDDLLSLRGYLKNDSDYTVSSSQSKVYDPTPLGISNDGFPNYSATRDLHMPSRGSGLASLPIGFDGYGENKQNRFSGGPFDGTKSSSGLCIGLPEERQGGRSYAEFDRIGKSRLNVLEEDYREQHMSRTDLLNHTVDERSHKNHMEDDGLWGQYNPSQVHSTPDKFVTGGLLHMRNKDLHMLGAGSSRPSYVTEGYCRYGGVKPEKHHADVDGQWSHFERSDALKSRGYGPSFDKLYDSPRKRSPMEDLSLVELSDRRLRQKYVDDAILCEHDVGITISMDENGARKIYNQVDVGDEINHLDLSKKPKLSRSNYEETWRVSREIANDHPSSSRFHPHHSIKPHKSDSRDIKKRLGPIRRKLHVSQRLVDKYKPSVKKRLAPSRPKKHAAPPWLKNKSSNIMASNQNESDGGAPDHDGGHLGDHLSLAKPEPPEKSEDFKQLMQSAFFKFLKQINETPIKRKKYMEHGKTGTLKCIVCGSNSDDFVNTESLAVHAFTSKKAGLRSQHLGLHKALCALLGWKISDEPASEWHCEAMTSAETSALKEDLIIWPPVVIVHNSTLDNTNPDERVIICTEKLDTKLRDTGFGSILKVSIGKPANQSVLLVKFSGTLSGLQEADRLHQSYIGSKHGRVELKQLKSESGTHVISANGEENFLYGHLGIAEDLDKLDFDTKKRCVLRSKQQILSIVN